MSKKDVDSVLQRKLDRGAISFKGDKGRTRPEFAAECDINNILRKYKQTGLLTHVNRYKGRYGNFSEVVDYQTALNVVADAQEMFMSLPAKIRAQFENNPSKFLAFVDDPKNTDEMISMGLLEKEVPIKNSTVSVDSDQKVSKVEAKV